jgi:ATP-dependent helicase/nuclease subunit B
VSSPRGQVDASRLIVSLESETRAHPYESKRLIGPDVNYGRELLAALARRTGGWIGWQATSLRRIAGEIAFVPLHAARVEVGSDVKIRVLVNRSLDIAIEKNLVSRDFALLGRSVGFRQTLLDSVLELRVGGVTPAALVRATADGSPARQVAAVLSEYEALLHGHGTTDSAGVFATALANFDDQAQYCLGGRLLVAPSLVEHGLPGAFLARLIASGAERLAGDSGDVDATSVDMFVAATPGDELREVFRRVIAEGRRWDDVEIVSTNVDTYGVALDVLCQQIGVGGTMSHGIPLARTRLGRILERCLTWLGDGLPADLLREALEAGELGANTDVEPVILARTLRELRIGWGRQRYEAAVRNLAAPDADPRNRQRPDESDDEYAARVASGVRPATALRSLLSALLEATPRVPERGSDTMVRSSVSALATAALGWLAPSRVHGEAEQQTLERVRVRLQELADLDGIETTFGAALATVRDALSDVRAWPLVTSDSKPWSSAGGMVHLTDISHAATTGRSRVFFVGFDSDATGGSSRQDPLIPDAVRAALGGDLLSTTMQRREERATLIGSALASLRGRVTLSYAATRSPDAGEAGPAPEMLRLRRALDNESTLSYADLRERLGAPASAVPNRVSGTSELLDTRDVWLEALSAGAILLNGETLVRERFRALDAGIRARIEARSPALTQFTGMVPSAAVALDPRNKPDRPISPSALEKLATCPLSWFYHYGLGLRAPEDPEYDPDAWLDSAQRGTLLHEIFEQFATRFLGRRDAVATPAASEEMAAIADDIISRWKVEVPPPGDVVLEQEVNELKRAAASFLQMERDSVATGDGGRWRYLEYSFGKGERSARYSLGDGSSLAVKGRVDRIDEMDTGSFRVIDYKTGRAGRYRKVAKMGLFNGGRQLQAAIYAAVLQELLEGPVARFEYRFPTERGQNQIVTYESGELADARPIVTQLLEHVRDGTFIATTSADDCKYCGARPICRISEDQYGRVSSPRAEWARENAETIDAYRGMLERRTRQETT